MAKKTAKELLVRESVWYRVSRKKFRESLKRVAPGVLSDSKSNLPILSHVLMVFGRESLEISANNYVRYVKTRLAWEEGPEGETEEVFSLAVPYSSIYDLVGVWDAKEVELRIKGFSLEMRGVETKEKAKIKGINAEEVPPVPVVMPDKLILDGELSREDILEIEGRVSFAVGKDANRAVLTGVYISPAGIYGADGFRASRLILMDKEIMSNGLSVLSQADVFRYAAKLFPDGARVQADKAVILMYDDTNTLGGQLINEAYPDVGEIFRMAEKKLPVAVVEADKKSLLVALKRAGLFAGDGVKVRLRVEKEGIKIMAEEAEVGSSEEFLPSRIEQKEREQGESYLEIVFNNDYMQKAVEGAPGEHISIRLVGENDPMIIRGDGDRAESSWTHLLMPIIDRSY